MSKKLFTYTAMAAVVFSLTIAACNKNNDDDNPVPATQEEDINYGNEDARIDQAFDEAENFANEAEIFGAVALKGEESPLGSGCATVTKDVANKIITIDFGPANCLCKDGRYRRGKILVSYTGTYREAGHVHNISFSDYYVNDWKVSGTKQVTNMGRNAQGLMYFNVSVNGSLYNETDRTTISKSANRVRTWLEGDYTNNVSDDVYSIRGSGVLTRPDGTDYDVKITEALIIAMNCSWIKQGVVQITPQGGIARILDYGGGACENKATVKVGTKTYEITLR